ncbi:MAG: hypothetical protein RLZZ219_1898 [Cyanobacteriota bacterium]|jgi:hypothetical protein
MTVSGDPPQPQPLDQLSAGQRALLRIVCWVAWADGDFAEEERQLLETLLFRLLPASVGLSEAHDAFDALLAEQLQSVDLAALVAELGDSDERQLAVKLAVQMLAVNQRPGDDAPVNPAEKQAYRRLLEALALPDAEVAEAEWAARQDLQQKRSLLDVIGMALAGWGAWPSIEAEGGHLPPGYWL